MEQLKYSVAVKLVGHESDLVQGYSVARYLVANEEIGQWLCGLLEANDNNWLLGIVLRHPDVHKRQLNVCLVRCGKNNHLMVTLDNANVPSPGTLVPTISIDLFLAMNHGGCFLDDKIREFGVLRDGSLFDHIRSAIASGFNLGDLRVYVYPNIHTVNEIYTDAPEGGRLVRFCFRPESWDLARDVMIAELNPYAKTIAKETSVENLETSSSTTKAKKVQTHVKATTAEEANRVKKNELKRGNSSIIDTPFASSKSSFGALSSTKKKSSVAASSCFYSPFCKKLARDCGGIRKGLCNEVNTGRIKIPTDEIFLQEKRKMKNKQKKDRKAKAIDLITTEISFSDNNKINELKRKGTNSTETSILFNPKEYLLLYKAWNDELTAADISDTGEKYTDQDCEDAATMLNAISGIE